jgi:hypothetical protein
MTVISKSVVKRLAATRTPSRAVYPPQVRDVTVPWLEEQARTGDLRALGCLVFLEDIWSENRLGVDLEATVNELLALFMAMKPPLEVLDPVTIRLKESNP